VVRKGVSYVEVRRFRMDGLVHKAEKIEEGLKGHLVMSKVRTDWQLPGIMCCCKEFFSLQKREPWMHVGRT